MKANVIKRGSAYVVDILIISIIVLIANMLFVPGNLAKISQDMNNTYDSYLKEEISFDEYFKTYSNLMHEYDKERVGFNILNTSLIIIFFIVVPYLNHGKTIGMMIFKIFIKSTDDRKLSIFKLTIRNSIINGLLYLILSIILVFIINGKLYFIFISILGILQILLAIYSGFMLIYRKDNCGLHDIASKTGVFSKTYEVKE